MKGDQNVVMDCSVAWTTPGRLFNLSSDREQSILVGDKPPDGITSLKWTRWRFCTAIGNFTLTKSGTSNSFSS